ncbi:MAG: Tetratricopeptide repeat protein [Deltaproteobacteria bacterium ADurb.Bin510]|nr:MAG: Tetratricopeptide repeat protein [Deltaproteobacteria bacterium ADurb.Bin510]
MRQSGSKLYLIFPGSFKCSQLRSITPDYLRFEGSVGLAGSTALIFSLPGAAERLEFKPEKASHSLIIGLNPAASASQRFNLASQAFAKGDLTTTIHLLDSEGLSPAERILKARSLWRAAGPYGDSELRRQALGLMAGGLKAFADDSELRSEYVRMLIRLKRLKEADRELAPLRSSSNPADTVRGLMLAIALENAQRQFQDAYADYGRLLRDYGAESIPEPDRAEFLATMGQTYLGLNDHRRALDSLQQALRLRPELAASDPDIHGRLGEAALRLGDHEAALGYYLKAINLGDPRQQGDNLVGLGDSLYNLGQTRRANLIYAEVERIAPGSGSTVIAKLREARALLDAEKGALSDATFEQVRKIYDTIEIPPEEMSGPISALVQIRKAQLYARHQNWDEAFEAYYKAWSQTRKDNPVHNYAMAEAQTSMLERLRELDGERDYASITALYERYSLSFLKDIQDPAILFLLANAMEQQGQRKQARKLYVQYAVQDLPMSPEALSRLASLDESEGNLDGALAWCDAYLKRFPAKPGARELRLKRGELLYRLGRNQEAAAALEALSRGASRESLWALSLLSDIYRVSGEWQSEARTLDRIIALSTSLNSPVIEKSLYIRAGQLHKAGDTVTAKRLYLRLMQFYPASPQRWWAQYAVAGIALSEGQLVWATQLLNQILTNAQDQILLNAARSRLATLKLGRDVENFRQQIKRYEGA